MDEPSLAAAANSRINRLADWQADHCGMNSPRHSAAGLIKVGNGPRGLRSSGDVAAEAWGLAADGLALNGTAYLIGELGGWHWAGILDDATRGRAGAVLLTIGPDGRKFAERFTTADEAESEAGWLGEQSESEAPALTPADFAPFLAMTAPDAAAKLAALAPDLAPAVAEPQAWPVRLGPLPWVAAAVLPAPEPFPVATTAEHEPEPVAPKPSARRPFWQRVGQWVTEQLAAIAGPWLDGGPSLELPRLVTLDRTPAPAID